MYENCPRHEVILEVADEPQDFILGTPQPLREAAVATGEAEADLGEHEAMLSGSNSSDDATPEGNQIIAC